MSDADRASPPRIATSGGAAGEHPARTVHDVLVGPSFGAEFNTIELDFAPEACVRFDDVRFAFESSFLGPEARNELRLLGRLHNENPERPASIFGHADPSGSDDYNKQLSGRRAQTMYALLTRRTDLWEDLYSKPHGADSWGLRSTQVILAALGHYEGPVHGNLDAATKQAVIDFQRSPQGEGLADDGVPGPATRAKLYAAYMDHLCVDENDQPFALDPVEGFLAQGADAGGKGDFQGCSEFNPDLVFSEPEHKKFQQAKHKAERDHENRINRRVVVYLFRPGSRIKPAEWPCPRAQEGVGGCRKRFHADGDRRRNPRGDERRHYDQSGDTFACNFYDRLATLSPCEQPPVLVDLCCKHRGTVVENVDPDRRGRLRVRVPTAYGDDRAVFAAPAVPYAGPGVGFLALPPVGANVWVDFVQGDADDPVWSGCFWARGEMPTEAMASPGAIVFKTERVSLVLKSAAGGGAFTAEADGAGRLALDASGAALDNGRGATIVAAGSSVSINKGAVEVL
jgi:hypothetical protein